MRDAAAAGYHIPSGRCGARGANTDPPYHSLTAFTATEKETTEMGIANGMAARAFDRRDFLKGASAAALGGLGLAGAQAIADEAGAAASGTFTYADTVAWTHEYDVVVIGFGGAGAVSAITAADEGASVLVVEKAPRGEEGGNTQYSGQNFGVCDPSEVEAFAQYYKNMRGDYSTPSDEMIDAWVEEFSHNEEWAVSTLGVTDYVLAEKTEEPDFAPEGLKAMRMKISDSVVDGKSIGSGYWPVLEANVAKRVDSIDVWYGSPATKLMQDPQSKTVVGVQVERGNDTLLVRARNGVILACGGYEASRQMMEDYLGLSKVHPIGTLYNTGDGVTMAVEAGARLWHMANVLAPWITFFRAEQQVRPDFVPVNPFLGTSYIQVGPQGRRWHNELEKNRHSRVEEQGESLTAKTFDHMWNVFDEDGLMAGIDTASGWHVAPSEGFQDEIAAGVVLKADTLDELAGLIDVPAEELAKTVEEFNAAAEAGVDEKFGRDPETMSPFSEVGPYYAWEAVRGVLNSQGGPERDKDCRIIGTTGEPIPHLYGAGELGFLAAKLYNGGGNLGDTGASGRIAGRNAAAEKDPLPPMSYAPVEQAEVGRETFPEDTAPVFENGDGVYYGSRAGIKMLTVKVTMDGEMIASVEVVDSGETYGVGSRAIETVPQEIVDAQSLDVDTVAGATRTSKAIIGAVKDAIEADYPDLAATAGSLAAVTSNPELKGTSQEFVAEGAAK